MLGVLQASVSRITRRGRKCSRDICVLLNNLYVLTKQVRSCFARFPPNRESAQDGLMMIGWRWVRGDDRDVSRKRVHRGEDHHGVVSCECGLTRQDFMDLPHFSNANLHWIVPEYAGYGVRRAETAKTSEPVDLVCTILRKFQTTSRPIILVG